MLPWNFDVETRKRKLDYSRHNKTPNTREIPKTHIFKNINTTQKKQESEWERAAEGFSGFTTCEKTISGKRNSLTRRQPQKYRICMPCDSESDFEVENAIKWSSSEDDLSDLESSAEIITIRPKKQVGKPISTKSTDIQWNDRIDFEDSDMELETDHRKCTSPAIGIKQQDEADLIEDADSRSSIVFSGSGTTKLTKEDNSEETVEEIEICSSTESSAASSAPSLKAKVKASEWVKSLDLKTPTKQSQSPQIKDDSAKKKKKYSKNSLADQLYKLQIREKSAVRMWNHQSHLEEKVSSKSVVVKILDYELFYSLQIARCREVDATIQSECYVLFSAEVTEDLNISSGTVVRIFPPWQKLKLQSSNRTVLLCTHYIKIEGNEDIVPQNTEGLSSNIQWRCPCVTGLISDYKYCPAFQFPCIPGVISKDNMPRCSRSDFVPSQTDHEQSLYLIQATQSSGTINTVHDSILDSIEKSSSQTGISFKALIHRVLHNIDTKEKVDRYSLLVEDSHGVMCEVQLPDDAKNIFGDIILNGEGRSYIFTGLSVLARTTRDRDPGLFSMIDSVWSGINCLAVSEESESGSCSNMSQALPPGFCYHMVEHYSTGIDLKLTEVTTQVTSYKETKITSLHAIKQEKDELKRLSFKVQIVAKLLNSELQDGLKMDYPCLLYVTDNSLDECKYSALRVKDTCYIPEHLVGDTFLRDVIVMNGTLVCDNYSQVMSGVNDITQKSNNIYLDRSFVPQQLVETLQIHDLCLVKGSISEIDESSAYSWEVCDSCGLDKLAEKTNTGELVCVNCKKVVREPVTKMRMEVYVSVSKVKSYRVKVDLLEETIQSLLPDDEQDDEGYDIGSVLNLVVGPISCVVARKTNNDIFLKEIKIFN